MHKASSVSVRGLALGPKVRVRKKKPPPPRTATPPGVVVPAFVPIPTADALVKELRKRLHGLFATLDPNLATTDLYDNCSQQAFRFFTTTNTITPEAFHHKINKLGLHASRKLCLELFTLVDQEDLGELTYATFAQRIFLPAGYFNFSKPSTPVDEVPLSSSAGAMSPVDVSMTQSPSYVHGIGGGRGGGGSASPVSSSSPSRRPSVSPRGGSGGPYGTAPVALKYETSSLSEIEHCIARKLEERTSRGTDRFRQAFRRFTKSEGVTFAEFHHHLSALQIHLSHTKCRELFNRFDLDHNGTIELSEFTAALFRHEEHEQNPVLSRRPPSAGRGTPSGSGSGSRSSGSSGSGYGPHAHPPHPLRLEDFEVEAGTTLSIQEILAKLRDKLEQHTSKETDRFRQAFRIFGKSAGIVPHEFNAAMAKLGLKLSMPQLHALFALFDFDKSGDLDLNEFVQGVMLDDSTKHWFSIKDREKVEETRRVRYSMAVQSVQSSWTIADIERMLREKIEQRTSRSSDCFRQAFRIFGKVNGIQPDEFHAALEAIGLALDRSQSDVLFQRFDQNGSGDIDLDEFIHGVLPPDYTGRQWVAAADEMHREAAQKKKHDAINRPDRYMTEIEMENWSLDEIERRIRDKIQQATSKSSDTFRQAFKIFKKCNHVTIDDFRESLLALGFRLTSSQCAGLFRRYDTDNSNDIDLQEFCLRILPPDYTGEGDHWSHSDRYNRQRQQEKLEYVKRSKNGLLQLPKFDEARVRYTRGHHDRRTFTDLGSDTGDDGFGEAPNVELLRPASPASRPGTPRATRPPQQPSDRPSSATSPRGRPSTPTPTSPRPMSPRVSKLSAPGSSHAESNNHTSNNGSFSPRQPASPRYEPQSQPEHHHQRPLSPRQPSTPSYEPTCASPRRPMTPRAPLTPRQQSVADEYADVEIVDDTDERDDAADERFTSQSLRVLRARRSEAAQRHHRHHVNANGNENETAWQYRAGPKSARATSVSGESTASFSSSVQRAVGGAKYTPTHSNALLLQRFLRVAAKRQADAAATTTTTTKTKTSKPVAARRPHTTRR